MRERLEPGEEMFFLIGADAFAEIDTWHRWREVIGAVDFIVVSRPGHDYAMPEGARVHRLETLALTTSSSDIRARLAAGDEDVDVPAAVLEYIRANHLYRNWGQPACFPILVPKMGNMQAVPNYYA